MKGIMIRSLLISTGLYVLAILSIQAQTQQILPYSFVSNQLNQQVPNQTFAQPDIHGLLAEDIEREKTGVFYRTGVFVDALNDIDETAGIWTNNSDGSMSWMMRIRSTDAKAIGIYFDYFSIPEGGKLFVYNMNKTHVVGPYTAENSISGDVFATAPVLGDEVMLEYNGPAISAEAFRISIHEIAYMYRNAGFGPKDAASFGDSDPCQVNANCSEGASWDAQRRSVVKIIVRDGNSAGLCSGAMINSTNNDCTPYVLTANHCGGGATAANYRQWVFYFNFETPGCANPGSANNLDDQTITGCLKMANSADVSDVAGSDFMLVHLKNRPASSFNAFMAGWSRSGTAATSGVGIHHPSGDVKKISTFTTQLTNSSWSGSNPNKHWGVKWAATANGHGVTEGGSSGSPIFDQIGRIVGDLSGGSSFCTNTNGQDVYGKFAYSWDQTAATSNRRLKDWLDKTNLNPTTLNGKEVNSCSAAALPTVEFVANNTTPSVGETVTFTNQSTGTAAGYQWSITPATHTYVNGTSAFSENPQVQFSTTSSYTVNLQVYNTAGYGIRTRTSYIKPHSNLSVEENDWLRPMVFPNPSDGNFQVNSKAEPIEKIELIDINGKSLFCWSGKSLSVSIHHNELATGVYFIKTTCGNYSFTEKLIINK